MEKQFVKINNGIKSVILNKIKKSIKPKKTWWRISFEYGIYYLSFFLVIAWPTHRWGLEGELAAIIILIIGQIFSDIQYLIIALLDKIPNPVNFITGLFKGDTK